MLGGGRLSLPLTGGCGNDHLLHFRCTSAAPGGSAVLPWSRREATTWQRCTAGLGLRPLPCVLALRMSVRGFAENLGVAPRTVAKWEKFRAATEPYPDNQAILDTALARADPAVHMRFEVLLSEAGQATGQALRVTAAGPRLWEYETWGEDLERSVVALNRQNFGFAHSLLTRWSARWPVGELDDRGLYLLGRTAVLEADLYRDQGASSGPCPHERVRQGPPDLHPARHSAPDRTDRAFAGRRR